MVLRHALCALALVWALTAQAEFSWELDGAVGRAERADQLESNLITVSATHYFDPVADDDVPLALAAFLDPITNVWVTARESDDRTTSDVALERQVRTYTLGGTYVFPQSRWYAGGYYADGDVAEPLLQPPSPSTLASDSEQTGHGVSVGKYFGAGATRLELSAQTSILESEQTISFCSVVGGCFTASASVENTVDTERLHIMHVRRFRSASYALIGQISRERAQIETTLTTFSPPAPLRPTSQPIDIELYDDLDAYGVGTEIYPTPTVGVRLVYTRRKTGYTFFDQDLDEDTLDVGASWFFRRNIGLELTLSHVNSELLPRMERAVLRVIGRLR